MTNFLEKRSEPRNIIDEYYSVEFQIKGLELAYKFKIHDISSSGICVIVKDNSELLKHIKVNDILSIKYCPLGSLSKPKYFKTEIRHITKDNLGKFGGHYLVGLLLLEEVI
ncbi:MAG: PilZ domain-containing protein [Desulfobacterales bacterium]|nr:PilZ domain-containing protein [Desulfobacterales bacterium]MBF0396796.1 PilZ domain-containing protein [Desulfobacterales bacterium]